jgi:hypothetical protein
MAFRWLAGLAFAATLLAAPAYAQVDKEMIVVTGQRIQNDADEAMPAQAPGGIGFSSPPYISIAVPADFVIFSVTLETGTRAKEERQRELERTFAAVTQRASRAQGVIVEVGEPGSSAAVETTAAKEAIEDFGDRSQIQLVFKFATQKGDTFPTVRTRAEKFISELPMTGRAEAVTGDLQYIGVTEPKKHREELLRKIAEDTRLLQTIFTGPQSVAPSMSLTGLEGRVRTRPSGPLEMEMYIPYAVVLGSPQALR